MLFVSFIIIEPVLNENSLQFLIHHGRRPPFWISQNFQETTSTPLPPHLLTQRAGTKAPAISDIAYKFELPDTYDSVKLLVSQFEIEFDPAHNQQNPLK